jgi:menaquinol-cytochrome c reductase iron-sulfur subunit
MVMEEKLPPLAPEAQEHPHGVEDLSRRTFLMNVGIALNAIVGIAIAAPVVVYLFGPVLRRNEYRHWVALGDVTDFHPGETRLVVYRNPFRDQWDGVTANVPAYVRCTAPGQLVVFAINCAHLGCPVRWFKESQLFMCPCHGGVYYADGSRASGPPERGLFTYETKIDSGRLMINAGVLPTLSNRASATPCPGAGGANGSEVASNLVTRIAPWPGTKTPTIG